MGFNNAKILVASSYTWDKKGSNLEKKKKRMTMLLVFNYK